MASWTRLSVTSACIASPVIQLHTAWGWLNIAETCSCVWVLRNMLCDGLIIGVCSVENIWQNLTGMRQWRWWLLALIPDLIQPYLCFKTVFEGIDFISVPCRLVWTHNIGFKMKWNRHDRDECATSDIGSSHVERGFLNPVFEQPSIVIAQCCHVWNHKVNFLLLYGTWPRRHAHSFASVV